MEFKDFLNESTDKVKIDGGDYTYKLVISSPKSRHSSAVWHLVFISKDKTILVRDAFWYRSAYNAGWFLNSRDFGEVSRGSNVSSPTTPYIEDNFLDWYVKELNSPTGKFEIETYEGKLKVSDIKKL